MSIVTKGVYFLLSLWKWYERTGGKLLDKDTIKKRAEICIECPHFTGKICSLCGCCGNQQQTIFNKLALGTERCPDNPPRWDCHVPDKMPDIP